MSKSRLLLPVAINCRILQFRTYSHVRTVGTYFCNPVPASQSHIGIGAKAFSARTRSTNAGTSRCLKTKSSTKSDDAVSDGGIPGSLDDWTPIYKFKHIVIARAIQRVKIYQTGVTVFLLLPWSLVGTFMGLSDVWVSYVALAGSALACAMLLLMGTLSSRTIGIMYVHKEDPARLRVARLTFFGSRTDRILPSSTFYPLTDSPTNVRDAYVLLQKVPTKRTTYPSALEILFPQLFEDKYYLSLKYGTILEPEIFTKIFGDISEL